MDESQYAIPEGVQEVKNALEAAGMEVIIPPHASKANVESRCKWCGIKEDLRFDVCFSCADAQAIIGTGKDMYDHGESGIELSGKDATARLLLLLKAGWRFVPSCQKSTQHYDASA